MYSMYSIVNNDYSTPTGYRPVLGRRGQKDPFRSKESVRRKIFSNNYRPKSVSHIRFTGVGFLHYHEHYLQYAMEKVSEPEESFIPDEGTWSRCVGAERPQKPKVESEDKIKGLKEDNTEEKEVIFPDDWDYVQFLIDSFIDPPKEKIEDKEKPFIPDDWDKLEFFNDSRDPDYYPTF